MPVVLKLLSGMMMFALPFAIYVVVLLTSHAIPGL